jgi:hypothetical protein
VTVTTDDGTTAEFVKDAIRHDLGWGAKVDVEEGPRFACEVIVLAWAQGRELSTEFFDVVEDWHITAKREWVTVALDCGVAGALEVELPIEVDPDIPALGRRVRTALVPTLTQLVKPR